MNDFVQDQYNVRDEAKYQIFISSTYEDLKDERQHVIREITRAEQFPVAMENFVASSKEQWATIERFLQTSGCLILLLGTSYGTIDKEDEEQRSFTEKEYDFADKNGIPILAFISTGDNYKDKSRNLKKLNKFREKVKNSNRLVCYFRNCAELSGAVSNSIAKEKLHFINPWYRNTEQKNRETADSAIDKTPNLAKLANGNYWNEEAVQMNRRYRDELDKLQDKWDSPLEWSGGKDFSHLFEIRDDDNVISDEQRSEGIIKSIRYVYTDESGKMMVIGWYLKA